MKKVFFTVAFTFLFGFSSFAHYLWIETSAEGTIGKKQDIRVHFGEYTYGVFEKVNGEAFSKVSAFTLWVVDEKGTKISLEVIPEEDHYKAVFIPTSNGTYTILLNNNEIDVIDYSQYNFGIFKTHYHAMAKFQVGNSDSDTQVQNAHGISIKNISNKGPETKLQVLYKGKPLSGSEVKVFVSDQWSKTLETDDEGFVSFSRPWDTRYIVEATFKEEVPGTYKGEKYDFIWHCVTHFLN